MAIGWNGDSGAVQSVFGRTGVVTSQAGDYSSALVSDASTAGGPTVAASFNALSGTVTTATAAVNAISPTSVTLDGFAVGAQPAYTTLLTLPLSEARSYHLTATYELTQASPLRSSAISISACARRESGGSASVSNPVVQITGSITNLQATWEASGNNALLRVRAPGGPTVDVTGRYFWREKVIA